MRAFLALGAAVICTLGRWAAAHPTCLYDSRPPDTETIHTFCPTEEDGACCNVLEEAAVLSWYNNQTVVTDVCAEYYKQVACGPCHSFSGHLYERLGAELGDRDGMTMKSGFCAELVAACEGEIEFSTYDGESYCEKHVGGGVDMTWSYPIDDDVTFPVDLVEVFPDIASGDLPDDLLSMRMTPDGSEWWLGGQQGQLVSVDASNPLSSTLILDIGTDMDLLVTYEEGLIDFAFNPAFSLNNYFYVSYTITDTEGGKNRLARFTYSSTPEDTKASVDILLTTIAKSASIHSAGWCGFKPSDYDNPSATSHDLYWSNGDGGPQLDADQRGHDLTNLHSTVVRISVPSGTGVDDVGYTIPSGNREGGLEEICANGFRNPFRCSFDRDTDELYCGDVGHIMIEEIDLVTCGSDYGWSRFEGSRCQEAAEGWLGDCAGVDRSGYTFPVYEYCHNDYDSTLDSEAEFTNDQDICGMRHILGHTVIMGYVYRGQKFVDVLEGAIIFADNHNGDIYYLKNQDGEWRSGTIISTGGANIVSFAEDNAGELYVINSDRIPYQLPCGDLCATTCLDQALIQPTYTSLGCFADEVNDRALVLQEAPECAQGENAMSPGLCASYCATVEGAVYFGVEYGEECFCGAEGEDYSRYGELDAEYCGMTCVGTPDELCGGFATIEVYNFTSAVVPTPSPSESIVPTPQPSIETPLPTPQPSTGAPLPTPQPSIGTPPTSTPAPTPGSTSEPSFTEVGCYEDTISDRLLKTKSTSTSDMTTEYCETFCLGSIYFGTEYGVECFCGSPSSLGSATSTNCNVPCAGESSEICGGSFAISVYEYNDPPSLPQTYLGCFEDDLDNRVMSSQTESSSMTNELCAANCEGYLYYGTQFGIECFCSNSESYAAIGESENCYYPCSGDTTQICGGFLALSVYLQETGIIIITDSGA